jgi:MoaA/NifB/PqqE/SkfB family radical SAM enzyme
MRYLEIALTNRCNLGCAHCFYQCGKSGRDLDEALVRRVLEEARDEGFGRVFFTGGEPFLHPRFDSILAHAHELGYLISVATNGWSLPNRLDLLTRHNVTAIALSLAGGRPESHDRVKGEGSFERVLAGIQACRERQILTQVSFIVDRRNVREWRNALDIMDREGVTAGVFTPALPQGRALQEGLALNAREAAEVAAALRGRVAESGRNRSASDLFQDAGYCPYFMGSNYFLAWDGWSYRCANAVYPKTRLADHNAGDFRACLVETAEKLNRCVERAIERGRCFVNCADCLGEAMEPDARRYFDQPSDMTFTSESLLQVSPVPGGKQKPKAVIPVPTSLHVLLTRQCDLKCNYCYLGCGEEKAEHLDIALLEKLLKEGRSLGIGNVVFTGGEPLLYPHLERAMALAADLGYRLSLSTAAWAFEEHVDLFLRHRDTFFIFGLDGASEAVNDAIKGREGAYRRVMDAIDWCHRHGYATGLHMTVTRSNYRELADFIRLADHLQVGALMIGNIINTGRAAPHRLSPEEQQECHEVSQSLRGILERPMYSCSYLHEQRKPDLCGYLSMQNFCIDWRGRCNACSSLLDLDLPFPSLQDCSLEECIRYVRDVHSEFLRDREREFPMWHPDRRFDACGFCLEWFRRNSARYLNSAR